MGTLQLWQPGVADSSAPQEAHPHQDKHHQQQHHHQQNIPLIFRAPQHDWTTTADLNVTPRVSSGSGEAPTPRGSSGGDTPVLQQMQQQGTWWGEQWRRSSASTEASWNAAAARTSVTDIYDMLTPRGSVTGDQPRRSSTDEHLPGPTAARPPGQPAAVPTRVHPSRLRDESLQRRAASERMLRPLLVSKAEAMANKSKSDRPMEPSTIAPTQRLPPSGRRRSSHSYDESAAHSAPGSDHAGSQEDPEGRQEQQQPQQQPAQQQPEPKAKLRSRRRYHEQIERIQWLESQVKEVTSSGQSIAEQLHKAQEEVERLKNRETELLAIQRVFESQKKSLTKEIEKKSKKDSQD
eukprot:scaffold274680_cov46-Prasinocladus_malaysianus.AAC.2